MTRFRFIFGVLAFAGIAAIANMLSAAALADTMNDSLRQLRGDLVARLPEADRIGGRE